MQTERVTFLTSPDHKAALDAFAATTGKSVGHVVREATSRYIAQPSAKDDDYGEELALLAHELNEAAPRIQASLERTSAKLKALHEEMDAFFDARGIR